MKGLTLTQPWATLVAIGARQYETRSWSTQYRGWVAIHAAKRMDYEATLFSHSQPSAHLLRQAGYDYPAMLERGVILAVADLRLVHRTEVAVALHLISEQERQLGDFSPGRYSFQLADIRRLESPIACRGMLGFWNVTEVIEAQIREAMQIE